MRDNTAGGGVDGSSAVFPSADRPPVFRGASFLSSFLAGGTAGVVTDLILFPLDTLKTRLQLRGRGDGLPRGSFYRGLLSNMAGALPYATTYWSLYEALKIYAKQWGVGDALVPGVAAAGAETCAMFVRNPFDVVKQQLQGNMHPSTRAAIAKILRAEGLRGFWAGYGATCACARARVRRAQPPLPNNALFPLPLPPPLLPPTSRAAPPTTQCAATCPLR